MPYLLDSDVLIYYINGVAAIEDLFLDIAPAGLTMSAISYMEVQQGMSQSVHLEDAEARFSDLLSWVPVIPFGPSEASQCAELRSTLQSEGRRVRHRALDLMIAATAIEHGLILLTNNARDYADIEGLLIESP